MPLGSSNDAAIFHTSDLKERLEENEFPQPTNLPNSDIVSPYFIVGDGGFPLKRYLMRPYVRSVNASDAHKVFNCRLSRARRIVECAFGTMGDKWRIFLSPLAFNLQTSEIIIMAVVALHNYIITTEMDLPRNHRRYYMASEQPNGGLENNGEDVQDEIPEEYDDPTGIEIRNSLADYFISDSGSVDWQWQRI